MALHKDNNKNILSKIFISNILENYGNYLYVGTNARYTSNDSLGKYLQHSE